MPLLPWGEWKPDVSDYQGQASQSINNALPRGDGYGPFPSFAALTAALPAACRGGFYALKSDGSVAILAGTVDRLYILDNTTLTWKPVSRVATLTSISNASPAVLTRTGHGFLADEPVVLSTTGSLPTGLTVGTVYYVLSAGLTANTFRVSLTVGGAAINTSSAGSGTHSVTSIYSSLTTDRNWRFGQFGNAVLAVQGNEPPQTYDLTTSSAFDDLGGSPPQAGEISIVGGFVVLSDLTSNPYRMQWSGLYAMTTWDGTNSSDFQDFADGGIVRSVAGGESGTIFQDQAIRRMTYIPGSPLVFQIERIAEQQGLYGPYSVVRAGQRVFFFSGQGFYKIEPGSLPQQIGRERVDRTFFTDLDSANLRFFIGASDPRSTRVYWAYKSANGVEGYYDSIIGYDYALDRWFHLDVLGQYLLGMSQNGLTLENLDTISASLDALASSLDDFATSVRPEIAQFDNTGSLGFFRGSSLEATFESAEQGTDTNRIMIRGFRPITDAATVYGSCTYRETTAATVNSTAEVTKSARTGRCEMHRSTRLSRFKVRIPAGQTWTYCAGIEPDVGLAGTR